jgi:WD40 repeat protein
VAVSSNAEYLLVATKSNSKLFSLLPDPSTSKFIVEKLGKFPHGARLATFTPAGDAIILVTLDSEVQIHPFLDEAAPTIRFPYTGERGGQIDKIAVSPDGKTFATSTVSSLVTIQSFDTEIPSQTLPQPSSAITSLTFLTPDLISVTIADRNRLLMFQRNVDEWILHPWCKDADNMPWRIGRTVDKCLGTFIVNNDTSMVWLWGANWIAWIKPNEEKKSAIASHDGTNGLQFNKVNGDPTPTVDEYPHWITYRYRDLLLVDCVSSTSDRVELVVIERPRHEIMEDITEPRFYRHEYGT